MKHDHDHFLDAMLYVMHSKGMKKIPKWKILLYQLKRKIRRIYYKLTNN